MTRSYSIKHRREDSGVADRMNLKVAIVDRNKEVVDVFASVFRGLPQVEVRTGDLLKVCADALISAGNSFGDMGGGIDKAIDNRFKGRIQPAVINAIQSLRLGELPVGDALVIHFGLKGLKHLVIAPTMRVPGNVERTINAYLAFRGALVAIASYNASASSPILGIACPGLCTGVGAMPYETSARQMLAAYRSVALGHWKKVVHPAMAPFADHENR